MKLVLLKSATMSAERVVFNSLSYWTLGTVVCKQSYCLSQAFCRISEFSLYFFPVLPLPMFASVKLNRKRSTANFSLYFQKIYKKLYKKLLHLSCWNYYFSLLPSTLHLNCSIKLNTGNQLDIYFSY